MRSGMLLLLIAAAAANCPQNVQAAEIGSRVGNFQLPDASGQTRSLQSYSGKNVVLVFWSFKCPVSLMYNGRMEAIQSKYGSRGVVVLAIASGANETPAEIEANANNLKVTIPILLDSNADLAEKLGAAHTPSVFILDGGGVLRYKGAIDNNKRPGENGRIAYVDDALDAILAGTGVPNPETKTFGCSIKRK